MFFYAHQESQEHAFIRVRTPNSKAGERFLFLFCWSFDNNECTSFITGIGHVELRALSEGGGLGLPAVSTVGSFAEFARLCRRLV